MASEAFDGRLTNERGPSAWPDNLFRPIAGGFGVHGRLGLRAKRSSALLWITKRLVR
ncbi:MAG TPA: hypothetical protein VKY65_17120 [Alphaproteobacteria bacterium]|nr:hypothetical protein [Alphaproteobacteria bacterium]